MAAGAGLGVEINLRVGFGPGKPEASAREPKTGSGELGSEKSRVTVFGILAGPLPFAVASLGAESSSSLLETTKPC